MATQTLIDDLEVAIASKDIGYRAETLRRVADLFASVPMAFSGEQIALFDDVMGRLVSQIDEAARAAFGHRLLSMNETPPNVLRDLALDDSIDVAGPILAQSDRLTEDTLIESAKTKSQDHLLAIANRSSLTEAVTDVLVERGNQQVVLNTATNQGAKFSETGYSKLIGRAGADDKIALCVWLRPDVPRQHLLKMFADASEAVRFRFEAADGSKAMALRAMIAQASDQIQTKVRQQSPQYAEAHARIQAMHAARELDQEKLREFAKAGKFDDTTISLMFLCNIPIGVIERVMVQEAAEQVIVLARAVGLSWDSTKAILVLQAKHKKSQLDLEQCSEQFQKLQTDTARRALQFYRMREKAAAAGSEG